jgi:hypothetical protein
LIIEHETLMKIKSTKFSVAVLLSCGSLFAGGLQGNYYADANREIFLLPRSAAMAGSDLALRRSASPLSNAASLTSDSTKEISLAYAGYFQNTYSTAALSYIGPVDSKSCIGVSASYVLVPGIEIYNDTVVPANIPTKTGSDFFFRISYGRKLMEFNERVILSAGAAVNAERLNLIGWTGYSIGADAGIDVLYHSKDRKSIASAGLLVENLTTNFTQWSSEFKEYAYPHLRIGLGWQREMAYIYGKLRLTYLTPDLFSNEGINSYTTDSLDADNVIQSPEIKGVASNPFALFMRGRGGAEYTIMNTISFRIGVDFKDGTISFGGGVRLFSDRAGFDFAYLDHDLASTYKLSVLFQWL